MENIGAYVFIIGGSIVILLSFLFSMQAKKTNIPAVLMLIVLGVFLQYLLKFTGMSDLDFSLTLEVLGIVGLIMIVLEAALELELNREKIGIILKSTGVALLGLLASTFAAAYIIHAFVPDMGAVQALMYATPLSILSSAIVIPSVGNMPVEKKEFHIYESTISDILGIMLFYFVLEVMGSEGVSGHLIDPGLFTDFFIGLGITAVVAVVASYVLILVFQHIQSGARLFLLIAMLLLLYSIAKLAHLSPLIIILMFGLMVSNSKLFFRWKLKELLHPEKFERIGLGLHIVTLETSFVVRTFFFVIFGASIALSSLFSWNVFVVSILLLFSIYLIRWIFLRLFFGSNLIPQLWIAPRGLITVLLFYAIPATHQNPHFNNGIVLFIIVAAGLIMTLGMIYGSKEKHVLFDEPPYPEEETEHGSERDSRTSFVLHSFERDVGANYDQRLHQRF